MPRNLLWYRFSDQFVRPVQNQTNRSTSLRRNPTFIRPFRTIGYKLQSFSLARRYLTGTTFGQRLLSMTRNPGIALTRPQMYINALTVSETATAGLIKLPEIFVADRGKKLYYLILECIKEKKITALRENWRFTDAKLTTVTSLELWTFIEKYKDDQNHVARFFANFVIESIS